MAGCCGASPSQLGRLDATGAIAKANEGTDAVAVWNRVREHYADAARRAAYDSSGGCCGEGSGCSDPITSDLYSAAELAAVPGRAGGASLGCGNPTALADLRPGEAVLDLGSGGGIDVLLTAQRVGPTGKAYGLDMTDEMLELARRNQREAGVVNAEFIKGRIEEVPLPDDSVDVVISNCVVNLSPEKSRVLAEAHRVLRSGGRLAIADIVFRAEPPPKVRQVAALWGACIGGALTEEAYRAELTRAGFVDIDIEITREYGPDMFDAYPELVASGGAIVDQVSLGAAFVRARKV